MRPIFHGFLVEAGPRLRWLASRPQWASTAIIVVALVTALGRLPASAQFTPFEETIASFDAEVAAAVVSVFMVFVNA